MGARVAIQGVGVGEEHAGVQNDDDGCGSGRTGLRLGCCFHPALTVPCRPASAAIHPYVVDVPAFGVTMTGMEMVPLSLQLEVLWLTALAAALGAVVGLERKQARKAAGLRTQALVAAASALIVALGRAVEFISDAGDPTRPLHAVITGIGFLGAGSIIHSKHGFSGVTTAAAVFTTSAIGVTVGLGAPVAAAGATVVALFVLRGLRVIDRQVQRVASKLHARWAPDLDDEDALPPLPED